MLHDNTLLIWLIGFIISLVISTIIECADKSGKRPNATASVLASAFLFPVFVIILAIIAATFPRAADKLDEYDGVFGLLSAAWLGIVFLGLLTFDSHYGKGFEDKTPKTEMTQVQYNQECREKNLGDLIFFNTENLHNPNIVYTFAPSNKLNINQ